MLNMVVRENISVWEFFTNTGIDTKSEITGEIDGRGKVKIPIRTLSSDLRDRVSQKITFLLYTSLMVILPNGVRRKPSLIGTKVDV